MGISHLLAPLPTVVGLAWNWVQWLDEETDGHNQQVHNHVGGMLDPMPQRLNLQCPPPFPLTYSHKNPALKMQGMHGRSSAELVVVSSVSEQNALAQKLARPLRTRSEKYVTSALSPSDVWAMASSL